MTHGNGGHDGGMHVCMTGHSAPREDTPYFGSVMAKLRPATRNVPSYVWVQNLAGDVQPRYLTGGFLGAAYSPLRVGTDLDNPSAPGFRVTAFDPADGRAGRAAACGGEQLLASVDPDGGSMRRFQERAVDLVTGPEARRAFDLEREPPSLRDRYGRGPLGQNLLLARRLIEAGVRLVSVTAWAGLPPGEKFRNVQTWDMHGDGAGLGSIFGTGHFGLGWALPRLDEAVSALLEDLDDRGLLETTLVVMVGEFGRSPKMSNAGRDHWPACYSALLAGAGIRGGMVYGASDRTGGDVARQPGVAGGLRGDAVPRAWACRRRRGSGPTASPARPARGSRSRRCSLNKRVILCVDANLQQRCWLWLPKPMSAGWIDAKRAVDASPMELRQGSNKLLLARSPERSAPTFRQQRVLTSMSRSVTKAFSEWTPAWERGIRHRKVAPEPRTPRGQKARRGQIWFRKPRLPPSCN